MIWTCNSLIQIPRVGPWNHSSVFCLIMTLWGEHLQTHMYYSDGPNSIHLRKICRFWFSTHASISRSIELSSLIHTLEERGYYWLKLVCTKRKTSVNLTHRTRLLVQVKQKNNCTHLNQSRWSICNRFMLTPFISWNTSKDYKTHSSSRSRHLCIAKLALHYGI